MATKTTAPHILPRLIRAKRAAAELGIPYSTLRDAHFRGELAVVRIGNNDRHAAWYVEREDIDRWIESRKEHTPAQWMPKRGQ